MKKNIRYTSNDKSGKKRKQKIEKKYMKCFRFWYSKWKGQIHMNYQSGCSEVVVA